MSDRYKNFYDTENAVLFKRIIYTVWIIIFLISIYYFSIGAYFSFFSLVLGVILFIPITIFLEYKSYHRLARLIFFLTGNFYIFTTSMGLGNNVNSEYFTISASLASLILFADNDFLYLGLGFIIPFAVWLGIKTLGTDFIPAEYIYASPDKEILETIHYIGAYLMAAAFSLSFIQNLRSSRIKLISSAKLSSLGEMAGGIAHEINNPLFIISGKARQVRAKILEEKPDKEKILDDLSKIESTVHRITKIIKGLRTFSRNSDTDPFSKFNMNEIVEDTLELCQEKIKMNQVTLRINSHSEYFINCKPNQISQVILNLIDNSIDAIQFLPNKWIEIGISRLNGFVIVTIMDSGLGISEKIIDKIMHPFFTTKDIGKGTGLGLSISKGIIESHHGTIEYEPTSKNTLFIIKIPEAE